jgi:NAD(P)-dependent dehydrogenase (short-subunit alcohol dehydrogenase family)
LVTGATSGIGEVTARSLAQAGATVAIVGRSAERIAATEAMIAQKAPGAKLASFQCDLSNQAEIRRLADEFQSRFDRLDVLVNNAGAAFPDRRESADGLELTFALNHMSYFLLSCLLADRLKSSAPARIVNVASDAHRFARKGFDFDDWQWRKKPYRSFSVYGHSKLANILFSRALAQRLEGSGVTANSLHPGFVATRFGENGKGMSRAFWTLFATLFAIPPEAGAKTSVYLATSPDVSASTGCYFSNQKLATPTAVARDDQAAEQLWKLSQDLAGQTFLGG